MSYTPDPVAVECAARILRDQDGKYANTSTSRARVVIVALVTEGHLVSREMYDEAIEQALRHDRARDAAEARGRSDYELIRGLLVIREQLAEAVALLRQWRGRATLVGYQTLGAETDEFLAARGDTDAG